MLNIEECIKTKSELKEWINYESQKYGGKSLIRDIFCVSEGDVLRKHQIILRKTEYFTNTNNKVLGLLYKIRLRRIQNKYGLHIPLNTCGKGLHIMHLGPILINGNAIVGKDCTFHINTALVAGGTDDYAPTLGNGIVVGIGAVILGNTHIPNYVAIGANAVVNKNIDEENIAVAGVPAGKISNNGSLEWNKKAKNQNFE